ncbi:exonuclease [Rhodococcus phage Peregrin]|nr:exonuclease [Rhodococcus phage Peregrin]
MKMSKLLKMLASEKLTREQRELVKSLKGSLKDETKTSFLKKRNFSASGLYYSSGACARKWQMLFEGVEAVDTWKHTSLRSVSAGTSSHEDLQKAFLAENPGLEVEKELWHHDPEIHAFVDIYDPELNIPIEIKTTSKENFEWRMSKFVGNDYHEKQLLTYMKILNAKVGFLFYEDRNSYDTLVIPVFMDEANTKFIDDAFEWMKKIEAVHKSGEKIKVFEGKRVNSKICSDCPIKPACDAAPEGTVSIPLLTKWTGE